MVLVSILFALMRSLRFPDICEVTTPLPSTTPQSFKFLKTPRNRRNLRQQTVDAIAFIRSNSTSSTDTSILLLRRLACQSEAAMTRADIESIEKQDIRRRYAGKQAPRVNRKRLTATMVIDGKELMKMGREGVATGGAQC